MHVNRGRKFPSVVQGGKAYSGLGQSPAADIQVKQCGKKLAVGRGPLVLGPLPWYNRHNGISGTKPVLLIGSRI